jgi:hypothetical protein
MMIIHANDILHTTFGKLNHHYFGWVEDAQGFVFMSGLVVGLVYGSRFIKHGFEAMQRGIWARIKTIYSHQIGLILIFTAATLIFAFGFGYVPGILSPYGNEPVAFPTLSALMVTGSAHMGILPMYIVFMTATPYALRLLIQSRYLIYGVIVATCWAIAQTRLPDALVSGSEAFLADAGYRLNLGIFFNVLGWQALFFAGLFIGFLMASKRLNTEFLRTPEMRNVFLICVALFFFFGIYDRIVFDQWISDAFSERIEYETDRGNLSTIYVITFAADLLIMVWMLGPGMTDKNVIIAGASKLLGKAVAFRPLVFLGQHSLHVFSAHILIVYVIASVYQNGPPSQLIGTAIIFASLGILYGVAWVHSWYVARNKSVKTFSATNT